MLSKMSKLVRIFRQLPFLQELGTGKFERGGRGGGFSGRLTGLVTVDNLFENPARYTYTYIYIYTHTKFETFFSFCSDELIVHGNIYIYLDMVLV